MQENPVGKIPLRSDRLPTPVLGFPVGSEGKQSNAMWETWVGSLGWENPLEEAMANPPVFLSGESPWREEPGKLQIMGSQRVRHD